ncbi:uncharacterized protein AMSG_06317 [Thecamonas trahens ATCC 50062]|uniref:C2H2-type domain-containing protein n=1 Tax=Thecamonas trahens ATCC 50062 TaxID=461836 RepID=A0A0L0DCW7_THETB|nr:hypothetical protein AMSG_06317 [Thecamonas trahens ATCC 50062]KNC50177.1 hypothetical protein AMSG_06317 [Thecamonas trahens ATCC 50062]|eukprot:XP_013757015.1 hypothetical protein AMSG_06317 [Thecamonas trahens ATCC 50062]
MASLSAERHEHGSSVIDYEFLAPANTNLSKFNLDELLAGMNEATAKFAIPLDNDGKLRCVYNHCQRRFDVTSDAVKEAAGIVVLAPHILAHFRDHAAAGGSLLYWNIKRLKTKRVYVMPKLLKRKREPVMPPPPRLVSAPSPALSTAAIKSSASRPASSRSKAYRSPSRTLAESASSAGGHRRSTTLPKYVDVPASKVPEALAVIAAHQDTLTSTVRQIPFTSADGSIAYYAAIKTRAGKYYCLHPSCSASISPNNLKKHMGVHRRNDCGGAVPVPDSSFDVVGPPLPKLRSGADLPPSKRHHGLSADARRPPLRALSPAARATLDSSAAAGKYACPLSACSVISPTRSSFVAHIGTHHDIEVAKPSARRRLAHATVGGAQAGPEAEAEASASAPVPMNVAAPPPPSHTAVWGTAASSSPPSASTLPAVARSSKSPTPELRAATATSPPHPPAKPSPSVLVAAPPAHARARSKARHSPVGSAHILPMPTPSSPLPLSRTSSPTIEEARRRIPHSDSIASPMQGKPASDSPSGSMPRLAPRIG